MRRHAWVQEFPAAVTVTDADGKIIEMNARAVHTFEKEGGAGLIGTNVLDCHPEPARAKLHEIMKTQRTHVYTIEMGGRKKLIYQTPWYKEGVFAGLVELSLEIPGEMPHFIRDGKN